MMARLFIPKQLKLSIVSSYFVLYVLFLACEFDQLKHFPSNMFLVGLFIPQMVSRMALPLVG